MKLNTKPFSFQLEAVKAIQRFKGRALVALPMGGTKTLISLMYLLKHAETRLPAIVVCPASAKWHWEREAVKHCSLRSEILEGMKPKKWKKLINSPPLTIINYDILGPWLPYLKRLDAGTIVFDEGHYLSSPSSRRSKNARELVEGMNRVLVLSGTPLANRPADLWHPVYIANPRVYPSWWPYAMTYCGPKKNGFGGWDFKGASNIPRLHSKLSQRVMFRKRKEDILPDLPAMRRIILPLEIEDRKQYNEARTNFLKWLVKSEGLQQARKAARAQRVTQLAYLKKLVGKLKLRSVFDWIDNFLAETDDKLILFGIHRSILTQIHERYKGSVLVTGAVVGRNRQLAWDKFLGSSKCPLLVGNIKAAGECQSAKGVSSVAFIEYAWVPTAHTQAEARVHGQGRGVEGKRSTAYYLVGRDTLESKLVEILQHKQKIIDQVLDGGKQKDNYDVFDRLVAALHEEEKQK